jgi:hypothetical protein
MYVRGMDREMLLTQLEAAKRRLAAGERTIADQKHLIESVRSLGGDTSPLDDMLTTFLMTQEGYEAEVEAILDELDLMPLMG